MTISISDRAVDRPPEDPAERPIGDPSGLLPFNVTLDDSDTAMDVIDALALAPFASGREPWSRSTNIARARRDALLMPAGGTVVRAAHTGNGDAWLVVGEGWTLRSVRWRNGAANVAVSAVSDELAEHVLADATTNVTEPVTDMVVPIGFWYAARGIVRTERKTTPVHWPSIRANYASRTAEALDRLVATTPDTLRGRLILLHGAPGTGKTTLLRALAHAWRPWCQTDCVLDPDRMFGDPSYLMEAAIGRNNPVPDDDDDDEPEDGDATGSPRWRLLLLEDCDELIRSEAKASTGQALSRLLNLTDGLLGQGRNVLVAITTNEDLARLHPATVRPGRCVAQIEVGPLPRDEAATWLGRSDGIGAAGATLAQLYALRDGVPDTSDPLPEPIGMYL